MYLCHKCAHIYVEREHKCSKLLTVGGNLVRGIQCLLFCSFHFSIGLKFFRIQSWEIKQLKVAINMSPTRKPSCRLASYSGQAGLVVTGGSWMVVFSFSHTAQGYSNLRAFALAFSWLTPLCLCFAIFDFRSNVPL